MKEPFELHMPLNSECCEEGLTKEPGGFSGRARLRLMARAFMMLAFLRDCTARLLSSRYVLSFTVSLLCRLNASCPAEHLC